LNTSLKKTKKDVERASGKSEGSRVNPPGNTREYHGCKLKL